MKNYFTKTVLLLLLMVVCSCNGSAQNADTQEKKATQEVQTEATEGMKFYDITLQEALDKAKAEGKKVFIDCYTKKCVPCKKMAQNIFPLKVCGDYFNPNYICIMKDMEEGEGIDIAKKFGVMIYPTYLILNSDGTLFTQAFAAIQDGEKFIAKMKEIVAEAEAEQQK